MSKYTTEVRFICETEAGLSQSAGFSSIDDILEKSWNKIFTSKCHFFEENYRKTLCKKILKHYYTMEIGAETAGLWKLWVNTRLEEIMPYYNQLYESELLKFEPLDDVNVTTTGNRETTGSTSKNGNSSLDISDKTTKTGTSKLDIKDTSGKDGTNKNTVAATGSNKNDSETSSVRNSEGATTGNNSNSHYDLYSDTPQGALNGVESEQYLTNARKITDNGNESSNTTGQENGTVTESSSGSNKQDTTENGTFSETGSYTRGQTGNDTENGTYTREQTGTSGETGNTSGNETYSETITGKRGGDTYSRMLLEYRETFLNIDMMVIEEFKDLFMGLW